MKKKKESIFVRVAFGRTEHTQSRGAIAKEGSERSTLIVLIANVSHSHVVQTLSQLGIFMFTQNQPNVSLIYQ